MPRKQAAKVQVARADRLMSDAEIERTPSSLMEDLYWEKKAGRGDVKVWIEQVKADSGRLYEPKYVQGPHGRYRGKLGERLHLARRDDLETGGWGTDVGHDWHSTKKKTPAQLQREINEALSRRKPRRFASGDPNNDDYLRFLDDVNDPPRTDLIRAHKDDRIRRSHSTKKSDTVRLPSRPGFEVLAKETKYGPSAYTFANRTQADRKAAEVGNGFEVYHWGRPWFVARKSHATKKVGNPYKDARYRVGGKRAQLTLEEAKALAERIWQKSGVIASIEEVAPRRTK